MPLYLLLYLPFSENWQNIATVLQVTVLVVGITCAIFENRSTTTRIESYPWLSGSWVMRSVEMICQGRAGISLGVSFPRGLARNTLVRWHRSQLRMYFPM